MSKVPAGTLSKSANNEQKAPIYMKYAKSSPQNWLNPSSKLKPSDFSKPSIDVNAEDYPMIIEFNNMQDNTSQVHSTVEINQPLFQPSPKIVVYDNYAPFVPVDRKIFFRNNDSVARRIKVVKPDTPFFDISAPKTLNGEALKQSKIASGMEVCFILTFKPQEVRDYSWDLVCSTEREKFVVPIRAVGMRPLLTFPDTIDFGRCPINAPTKKKVLVQNIGTSVAKLTMHSSSPEFLCPAQEITIEAGAAQPLELFFTPLTINTTVGECEVEFSKLLKCYVELTGEGKNVEVSLSTPSLTLEPSYISLMSQKTLKIKNLSEEPITYMWKSFADDADEEAERKRLLMEINRMDDIERQMLQQRITEGYYSNNHLEDLEDEENRSQTGGKGPYIPMAAKADHAAIVRKYRNLRCALDKDSMQFVDDIFEITPIEGQVWAHSEMEIVVCFRPDTAAQYTCMSYLAISGRHARLPLQLMGQGIGPHASLSFDVLDIGDVFINDEHFYELSIRNKGDIPAQWTFMSSLTRFGNKFKFSPTDGYLLPNQSQVIKVRFESDVLGEFSEHFRFSLQGNEDMLICQIKGQVIGPTFHFDCNTIDFGIVSFDFLHSTNMRLINTSSIPMVFNLHIPQDGTYLKKEFNIEPSRGTLGPKESTELLLEFIPSTVKVFDYSLAVDVLGVGDVLLSIPITAQCIVSTVKLETKEVEFGDCFIRYPYERELKLTNMSKDVHTKFEIAPQPKQTKSVASYETEPSVAVIEPGDSMRVKIRLVAQKLGSFKLPMMISVVGSQEPPMQGVLSFNTVGPKITVGSGELKWGNIECLKDSSRTLTIMNEGLITASMKIFLKMARSCYRIDVRDLVLEAQSSFDLPIVANLDDSIVNKDEIHIVVDEGDNLMVPLIAKGIGTAMYCRHDVSSLDFGVQLTNTTFERQIVLENKGRRPQQLKWTNRTVAEENEARAKKAKKLRDKQGIAVKLPRSMMPMDPTYTVTPEEITLRPRTATTFTFKGQSTIPKQVSEIFVLESKVGKDKSMKKIIEAEVRCEIVNPLLQFSKDSISYLYSWKKGEEPSVQKFDITLKNASATVLSFLLKTEIPFNLSSWEHTLSPGQEAEITVDFDPGYRDDRVSHVVEKALTINYRGHPQRDSVPLTGEVIFPNLKFDTEAVHFGCVLNDTVKTLKVKASNSCKIPVNYEWIFLDNQQAPKKKARGSIAAQQLPASQIFDILPIKSTLLPSESEIVDFSMLGNANSKFNGHVICVVDGGPEYKFPISGEASTVAFSLNRSMIDFGKVLISEKGDEELIITNNGKVAFTFDVVACENSGVELFEIIPSSGKVIAGQSSKVIIRIRPGLPMQLCEQIQVSIGHFDPVKISCFCQGIMPSAVVLLPRQKKIGPYGETEGDMSRLWENFLHAAVVNLTEPNPALLPPENIPDPAMGTTALPPQFPIDLLPPVPPYQYDDDDEYGRIGTGRPLTRSAEDGDSIDEQSYSINTRGVPQLAIEVEMQRLTLCHFLKKFLADKLLNGADLSGVSGNTVAQSEGGAAANSLQAFIARNIDMKEVMSANYICDFGNVIVGQTRKKIFKVTNGSVVGQLNWTFDKRFLAGSGFSIEPEKIVKMLEGTTIDFEAKYFARPNQKTGQKTKVIPLESRGSPSVNIILTANACQPEVDLSTQLIDFGKLLIGRSCKMHVRLLNPTPVKVSWLLKSVVGKEENRFTCEPSSGQLKPGKRTSICIEFIPSEARRYATELLVKVENNKKPKALKITGEGIGCPIRFEPNLLELGPVVPYTAGEEGTVTVTNLSEVALEFYSVDWDNQYREEEDVLSAVDMYDSNGIFRTEIREPGNSLPAEIFKIAAEKAAEGDESPEIVPTEEAVEAVEAAPELESAPLRTKPMPRDENKHQDIVLVGPPLAGITTHSNLLSKKLQISSKSFDELVEEVALTNDALGLKARMLLNKVTEDEAAALQAEDDRLLHLAEQSKAEAIDLFKKDKKNKGKEVPHELTQTAQVLDYNNFLESKSPTVNTLSSIIDFRMKWKDVGYGFILDGVGSKYFQPEMVLQSTRQALPNAVFVHLSIQGDDEGYASWLSHLYRIKLNERDSLSKAFESTKKAILKYFKVPKGKPGAYAEFEEHLNSSEVKESLPTGDENWLNPEGQVLELDSQEIKALEDKDRNTYLYQMLYQNWTQMKIVESNIQSIDKVWSYSSGLRTLDNPSEQTEGGFPTVYFSDYKEKMLSVLTAFKSEIDASKGAAETAGEHTEEGVSSDSQKLADVTGSLFLDIAIEGYESEDVVYSNIVALLPTPLVPPPDKDLVPPPAIYQVFRKPLMRVVRKPIRNFEIVVDSEPSPPTSPGKETSSKSKYRWVVEPNSSIELRVKFRATSEGKFESSLEFEVMNTLQKYSLFCRGISELPKINDDTRNVFLRRQKGLNPTAPLPQKRFVLGDNFYSFGPLSLFKKQTWKRELKADSSPQEVADMQSIESTNMDIIRLTNTGKYKCNVDLAWENIDDGSRDVFQLETRKLDIEEGETKEVKVWALPREAREYKNNLVLCVENNPFPIQYMMKCWGVDPTVEIDGPWGAGLAKAEEAVAQCTDKKLIKDLELKLAALKEALTLDFERILIGKTDTRSFTIKNTCLLPVAWEIDLGDFKDSPNISIEPMSGLLPINTTLPVVISFTSPDPLMLTGKFSLRYSDHEGGLASQGGIRVITKTFRAVAEAYKIIAVSLNSAGSEQGGSEIDFGLIRVGDYAIQSMKMGNKGKYKIGYSFKINTPLLSSLIKIEPMEGTIDYGNTLAEIKVTFCSKAGEIILRNNKDVIVQISEPLTGEIVEKFPLFISANAKYNKFRLQPSKGLQFGAVRFDSDAKMKRVELRNEGNFEITYVVCAAMSEVDELDNLDTAALQCYAFATPAAIRAIELGDDYLKRVASAAPGGGGGKPAAKPAKGKGVVEVPTSSIQNPLVQDPDNVSNGPLPTDPLTVGAFKISPRISTVQPGQSVGIDMTFDPSGCKTVKERLRICVSAVDPKDSLSQTIRSFEVTGESCVPAIVTDDVYSIFEEQEIVPSLADIMSSQSGKNKGEGDSGGGGKFEKMAVGRVVYAEAEKMLAFGPVSCVQAQGRGVVERIRISNPTKIDIKVKFKILSLEAAAAALDKRPKSGNKGKAAPAKGGKEPPVQELLAFTAQPERWEIPPHEHRFVNVYFNPTEIKSYRSVFLAEIDDEGIQTSASSEVSNAGKALKFDLGGSGTLPCIGFESPTERAADGSLLINFDKVLQERSSRRSIILRNDGVMPATCLFTLVGHSDFIFSSNGSSLTVPPGEKQEIFATFAPKSIGQDENKSAKIKISVLHNQFDQYNIDLKGIAYTCDAIIDTIIGENDSEDGVKEDGIADEAKSQNEFSFPEINLSDGPGKSSHTIMLKSRSPYPLKFELSAPDSVSNVTFSPSLGHLDQNGRKEVVVTFSASEPIRLEKSVINCTLSRIEYAQEDVVGVSLRGRWDDSMKSYRRAAPEDLAKIEAAAAALSDYKALVEAEAKKGKKAKPVGPPPPRCLLELAKSPSGDGETYVTEIVAEPLNELVANTQPQQLSISCSGTADMVSYSCTGDGDNISFRPTFMFQATAYKFVFTNKCNLTLPIKWTLDDFKRRGTRGGIQSRLSSAKTSTLPAVLCPFSIDSEECEIAPKSEKQFTVKFLPLEAEDFVFLLKGETLVSPLKSQDGSVQDDGGVSVIRMVLRGTGKRPICHFDINETLDYMSRRTSNLKNENGLFSNIEATDFKVVELESVGLQTRNTFRFHVTNPTGDNYEFIWESMGDPSPFWRCVQSAGMMFAGKRIEMVFEYLPEEISVAEAFFKFKIPHLSLEQIFLFTGKVREPNVSFSTSKVDYHSVMLGGEGSSETVYIENKEHLPFNFAFDRQSLLQLEGPHGPVLNINPKSGTVGPHSKVAVSFMFKPQEEVLYNFNLQCDVKRKPSKLSINVKGEGYAVHPLLRLEQSDDQLKSLNATTKSDKTGPTYLTLLPAPATNIADFGAVQILDSISKTISVTNNGKFNFDYLWSIDSISPMLSLTGGKMGGTLLKGEELSYKIGFSPQSEESVDGSVMTFTVAGKYVYNILCRGQGVKPALRFSSMNFNFGPCFITSPGGSTVVEEQLLRVTNHDPSSNISIECAFQKTRALWVECPPTVVTPGMVLEVPIRFAPRDVKEYAFVVPFIVNGTTKVPVNVVGNGINARLELVNGSQRRTNFGLVNVGSDASRNVAIVNRSKKALPIQLLEEGEYGGGALSDRCISFSPKAEIIIGPRETVSIQLLFSPNKRISQFSEDLLIRYAGITRKLLSLAGKAQGVQISLDSDSLPFGVVVLGSQKVRKLTLENTGDISITYQWSESTFGQHFSISPLSGKVLPGNEISFDVVFKPLFVDEDIRQEGITLMIPGLDLLRLTCTGSSIAQPNESIQTIQFNSLARQAETKAVKINNPTEKDWYLSPSLQGEDWKIPHEIKVPAKGAADIQVTYFPLSMAKGQNAGDGVGANKSHSGQLFVALPDGSAQLYKLFGTAGPPTCSGQLSAETPAKKPAIIIVKVKNWLNETQRFDVKVDIKEKPTPATFVIAANATEIGPNGTKEFPVRFIAYTEGVSKGTITFTNPATGEYTFFEFTARTTVPEVLETISVESPVRQTARAIITMENPLPLDSGIPVTMGSVAKPSEWWTCDSKYVRINELSPLSGNNEGTFELEYRPLMPTNQPTEHLVTIITKELGVFKYKLVVKATPPLLKQSLKFNVPLGAMQTEQFIFRAYNNVKVDYTCAITKPDAFSVQKILSVDPVAGGWDGDEVRLGVVFEPTEIGQVRDTLTVNSAEGGQYICELIADCSAPMPQGPFNVQQGAGSMDIPFRNCFVASSAWAFSVDSSAFRLPNLSATVPGKTEGKVAVFFEPKEEHMSTPGGIINAKLFVTCSAKPTLPPWVFYLRGKIDPNAGVVPAKGKK